MSDTRYTQINRIFAVIECLAPLRYGASVRALAADIGEITGAPVCVRTVYRDLANLETLGVVCKPQPGRYRLADGSVRAAMAAKVAERLAEARESSDGAGLVA